MRAGARNEQGNGAHGLRERCARTCFGVHFARSES
jgi:hypothetical protein